MAKHTSGDGGIPPRDAHQSGLKRVMTGGGTYGTRNYTVRDLRDVKGQRVLTETLPFTAEEAAAAEAAGIDTMKVRFDPSSPETTVAIRRAAPNTFMSFSVACSTPGLRCDEHRGRWHHVPVESCAGAGSYRCRHTC